MGLATVRRIHSPSFEMDLCSVTVDTPPTLYADAPRSPFAAVHNLPTSSSRVAGVRRKKVTTTSRACGAGRGRGCGRGAASISYSCLPPSSTLDRVSLPSPGVRASPSFARLSIPSDSSYQHIKTASNLKTNLAVSGVRYVSNFIGHRRTRQKTRPRASVSFAVDTTLGLGCLTLRCAARSHDGGAGATLRGHLDAGSVQSCEINRRVEFRFLSSHSMPAARWASQAP
jgi:hypothetical protein